MYDDWDDYDDEVEFSLPHRSSDSASHDDVLYEQIQRELDYVFFGVPPYDTPIE